MESLINPTKQLIAFLKDAHGVVDLSAMRFLHPIQLLPMAAIIIEESLKYKMPASSNCAGYLNHFNFPNGYTQFKSVSSNYIPIYKFQGVNGTKTEMCNKSDVLKNLMKIMLRDIGSPEGAINALELVVDEIVSNVGEHSGARYGWINAQYYPKKKYLDVCILDRGKTITGKYKEVGKIFSNDRDSLKSALEGESSKPEKIRGSGLPTFVKMITKGFAGEMVVISGNAIAFASKRKNPLVQSITTRWGGTIVAFRIPNTQKPIDYTLYIE